MGASQFNRSEYFYIIQVCIAGFCFPLPLQLPVHQHTQIAVIRNKADIFGVTESLETANVCCTKQLFDGAVQCRAACYPFVLHHRPS